MILSKLHLDTYEAENNRSCCVDFLAIPYLKKLATVGKVRSEHALMYDVPATGLEIKQRESKSGENCCGT